MRAFLVLAALITLACGGVPPPRSDAGGPPAPQPPLPDAGQPLMPMDAGVPPPPPPVDAGTPPVDAGTPSLVGLVDVEVSAGLEQIIPVTTTVSARFGTPDAPATNCRVRTVDGCLVTDCDVSEPGDGGVSNEPPPDDGGVPAPPRSLSAGRLTVDEGSTRLALEQDAMTGEYHFAEEGERLRPGQTLVVTAAGAEVPGFMATLPLPERLTVSAPTCSLLGCGTLDRARDFAVEWAGARGPVTVTLSAGNERSVRIIECVATTSPASIPASAMSGMPTEYVLFQVARRNEAAVRAGDVAVTLRATTLSVLGAFLQVR